MKNGPINPEADTGLTSCLEQKNQNFIKNQKTASGFRVTSWKASGFEIYNLFSKYTVRFI